MLTKSVIDAFAAVVKFQADSLPAISFAVPLGYIAMFCRWFSSFDILFDMVSFLLCATICTVVITFLTVFRIYATIWNAIRGSGV